MSASAPADGPWVYSTNLPAVAVRFDTEFYNGKMYLLGFRTDGAGTTDGSIWVYDAALDTWSDTGIDMPCLLYTSDAADERSSVDLGGRRIIKKKNT